MRLSATRLVMAFSMATVVLQGLLVLFWKGTVRPAPREEEARRSPPSSRLRQRLQPSLDRLRRQHLQRGRSPRPGSWSKKEGDLASKWLPGARWSASPNATGRDWLPEFGGRCRRGSQGNETVDRLEFQLPRGCVALALDDKMNTCDLAACAPNLFLIGASKSGTTTLFEAIAAHPRVFEMFAEEHTDGETHVWTYPRPDRDYVLRAARWAPAIPRSTLLAFAPKVDDPGLSNDGNVSSWSLEASRGGPAYVLEYTPHYLVMPEAPQRICATLAMASALPCERAKFVVMLRDPASRAFSQYVMKTHMRVKKYDDKRSFAEAVRLGRDRTTRFAACWDAALKRSLKLEDFSQQHTRSEVRRLASTTCNVKRFEPNAFQAYVLKSAYYYQFLPWLAAVDDSRTSFAVLTLETFGRMELKRLLESFLGLALFTTDDDRGGPRDGFRNEDELMALVTQRRNVARDGGKESLPPDMRALLDDYFRPMNAKLDGLIAPLLGGRPTGYPT